MQSGVLKGRVLVYYNNSNSHHLVDIIIKSFYMKLLAILLKILVRNHLPTRLKPVYSFC